MPTLTRRFINTSLAYLIAAMLLGLLLPVRATLGLPLPAAGLQPVYFHLLMVGWVTQLIFGVVFWMFPKSAPSQPRGRARLVCSPTPC